MKVSWGHVLPPTTNFALGFSGVWWIGFLAVPAWGLWGGLREWAQSGYTKPPWRWSRERWWEWAWWPIGAFAGACIGAAISLVSPA